jgi:hypothetical protein
MITFSWFGFLSRSGLSIGIRPTCAHRLPEPDTHVEARRADLKRHFRLDLTRMKLPEPYLPEGRDGESVPVLTA